MNENEQITSDKFSILIPVYNEENNILKLAEELDNLEIPYLFVDDGSIDKTMTTLWMKDIPALYYYPRKGTSYAIKVGATVLINQGYNWILLVNKIKKSLTEEIQRLDNALLFHEEESKIFITESGIKLIHKDIFKQIKSRWFNTELKLKIWLLKWKVIRI